MTHTCTRHPAPVPSCYQNCRCRCDGCRKVQARYAKHRRIRRARGEQSLVDAEPARAHIRALMEAGMTHTTIAVKAGLGSASLQPIIGVRSDGYTTARIHRDTEARILSVTHTEHVGRTYMHATAARRYLQDLALRGYGAEELSHLSGVSIHTITTTRSGKSQLIRTGDAEAIETTHRQLEGQHPVTTSINGQGSVKSIAHKNRYAPLAAWDDITNPNERPKGTAA